MEVFLSFQQYKLLKSFLLLAGKRKLHHYINAVPITKDYLENHFQLNQTKF